MLSYTYIVNYLFILFSYESEQYGDDCYIRCKSKGGRLPGDDEIKDFSKINFNQTKPNLNFTTKIYNITKIHQHPDFRYFVNAEYSFTDQKWFWRHNQKVFKNEKWAVLDDRANPDLRDILVYVFSIQRPLGDWNGTSILSSNYELFNNTIGYYSCFSLSDKILKVSCLEKTVSV